MRIENFNFLKELLTFPRKIILFWIERLHKFEVKILSISSLNFHSLETFYRKFSTCRLRVCVANLVTISTYPLSSRMLLPQNRREDDSYLSHLQNHSRMKNFTAFLVEKVWTWNRTKGKLNNLVLADSAISFFIIITYHSRMRKFSMKVSSSFLSTSIC